MLLIHQVISVSQLDPKFLLIPSYTYKPVLLSASKYVLISLLNFTMIHTINFLFFTALNLPFSSYISSKILYIPVQHNVEFQSRTCFLRMEYIDHFHYSICSASVQNFCHWIVENETPRPLMIRFHPVSKGKVVYLVICH